MIPQETNQGDVQKKVEKIASEMYTTLAEAFPVCCSSDEFYYFPQTVSDVVDWSVWDDFSPERVDKIASDLGRWETALEDLSSSGPDLDTEIDIDLLLHSARTLREQLQEVRFHRNQPTFHLTVTTIGLIQAMDSEHGAAWSLRVEALPEYLGMAEQILSDVPVLYQDLGYQMIDSLCAWIKTLAEKRSGIEGVHLALRRYRDRLNKVSVREEYHLAPEMMERIVFSHMATGMTVTELLVELGREKEEMLQVVKSESGSLYPAGPWQEYWSAIPAVACGEGGKRRLLEREILNLKEQCLELGLTPVELAESCPVRMCDVHESMTTVRAADSYSARPGHPPSGGTFYIFGGGSLGMADETVHPVYRMTAAHETWPGHHLLDVSRWNLERPLRRPIERPVFYEGWSCFSEQLLVLTGYFSQPWDNYILARRRLRHATRGTVDLLMHTGRLDLEDAAELLAEAGFSRRRALETVRKYALRPGYQMCYTVGYRRFRQLLNKYAASDLSGFSRTVLTQGEIGFGHLAKVFQRSSNQ